MSRLASEVVRIEIPRKLPIPMTDEDIQECERLKRIIEAMNVASARLADLLGKPAAVIQYSRGPSPARHWGKWLWAKVVPDCTEYCWLGRLAAFVQSERTLIIVPRPDHLDESMADHARKRSAEPGLLKLKLGIVYPPHQCMRTFDFRQ